MDVYVIQVLSQEELEPDVKGDLKLVDCEDQDEAEISVSAPLLARYTATLNAFTSGAHWISTNYPVPGLADRWETSYVVAIPGGDIARCNPLVASPACTGRHFSSD